MVSADAISFNVDAISFDADAISFNVTCNSPLLWKVRAEVVKFFNADAKILLLYCFFVEINGGK